LSAVAVGEVDLRPAAQADPDRVLVGRLVQLAELARGQLDGGAPHRGPLGLADDDERRYEQQERQQRAADGHRPAGVLQSRRKERQDHGRADDDDQDQDVEHEHEHEERNLGRVAQPDVPGDR